MPNLKNHKNEFTGIRSIYACRSEKENNVVFAFS